MPSDTQPAPDPKWMLWGGWILTILPALMLLMSGVMKLLKPEPVVTGTEQMGWDESLLLGLGIVEIACTVIYLIPRTAVLGAILLTGYLGGATATHVRIHDPFFIPVILGVVIWGGLYLRESRLRAVIPWRR